MVNPIQYLGAIQSPLESFFQGQSAGLGVQERQQALAMNEAREARAQELHPLALEGAGLDMQRGQASLEAQQFSNEQAQMKAQRQQDFFNAFGNLSQKGRDASFEDYQSVSGQFPEFAESVNQSYAAMDDAAKAGVNKTLAQVINAANAGQSDRAQKLLDDYAEAAKNLGDDAAAATAEAGKQLFKTDPEAALAMMKGTLAIADPDLAKSVIGGSSGNVQSSESLGAYVTKIIQRDGNVSYVDARTGDPIAAQDIERVIQESFRAEGEGKAETLSSELDVRTEKGGAAKLAEGLGTAQAKFVTESIDGASQFAKSISTVQDAINAIDNGAKSGPVYKMLPNFSEESASLQNAMDRMGLDVIGSVTFGALSKPELELAMETAVPRNLEPQALRSWLTDRQDALRKARVAMIEQAQFLSDPSNTLEDWANQIGADIGGGEVDPLARFAE